MKHVGLLYSFTSKSSLLWIANIIQTYDNIEGTGYHSRQLSKSLLFCHSSVFLISDALFTSSVAVFIMLQVFCQHYALRSLLFAMFFFQKVW